MIRICYAYDLQHYCQFNSKPGRRCQSFAYSVHCSYWHCLAAIRTLFIHSPIKHKCICMVNTIHTYIFGSCIKVSDGTVAKELYSQGHVGTHVWYLIAISVRKVTELWTRRTRSYKFAPIPHLSQLSGLVPDFRGDAMASMRWTRKHIIYVTWSLRYDGFKALKVL